MNLEKFMSWRYIRPLPSGVPKEPAKRKRPHFRAMTGAKCWSLNCCGMRRRQSVASSAPQYHLLLLPTTEIESSDGYRGGGRFPTLGTRRKPIKMKLVSSSNRHPEMVRPCSKSASIDKETFPRTRNNFWSRIWGHKAARNSHHHRSSCQLIKVNGFRSPKLEAKKRKVIEEFNSIQANMNSSPEIPFELMDDKVCNGSTNNDVDSDTEDDPGRLLNAWLGQLNTLKQGLDTNRQRVEQSHSNLKPSSGGPPPCMRRKEQKQSQAETNLKSQYRCSLINLEDTQDDELDAILGELSVLGSQLDSELAGNGKHLKQEVQVTSNNLVKQVSKVENRISPTTSDDLSRSSGSHSRSSSGSVENGQGSQHPISKPNPNQATRPSNGQRTESPDNDSAFCDNLSMLSSCSASSSSRTDQSKSSGVSSSTSPTNQEEQDAKIKAEKIKLAIEKIKEASIKKLFVKVFTSDGSAKSILIDEKMSVAHVTRVLAEKNHVKLDPKWTIVELVPDLYMERVYEDHENLVENCLMWKTGSKNTLWFIERPEKYDLFVRPELYLLGSSSSQKGDHMEDHSRQELLEEYFSSSGVGAPEVEGFIWLKAESKKSWKKFFFVLRSSGLYYAPKGKKTSKDLICLSKFDVNQVYYGAGWRKKYKAPSDYCFAIKHPQLQAKSPKYIRYLCVDTERELHQWVTGIRIAKNGKQMFDNYRAIEEEITHADIDILTSKRLSVNSPNSLHISSNATGNSGGRNRDSSGVESPARTPSSENKSLDSALSSGIASDLSQYSGGRNSTPSFNGTTDSSEAGSSQHTPVNTIERTSQDNGARSISRSSKSSSSSGCLSDSRSSLPGVPEQGFESDFPAGGTIKKRPSVNPRIPLTSTTWGLVKDSDEENNEGPNVRVGGGGTLLRHAMRHSMRKNSLEHQQQNLLSSSNLNRNSNCSFDSDTSNRPGEPMKVMAEVHNEDHSSRNAKQFDPHSADFETNLHEQISVEENFPLPPPPRDESLDRMSSALDDLPPPPPELYEEPATLIATYQSSPANDANSPGSSTLRKKPVPLPPSLKRNSPSSNKPNYTRKISFDDNVQLIGEHQQQPVHMHIIRRSPIPPPNKLYGHEENSNAAPPREFLSDLQRVMNKKWQIAEKCKTDRNATPHQVLGFRDELIPSFVGQGHTYNKDNSVGAWVLQSQHFNEGHPPNNGAVQPPVAIANVEPLYAVSSKQQLPNSSSHYSPSHVRHAMINKRPVVLREPTPEYDPYATLNGTLKRQQNGYVSPNPIPGVANDVSNYSTLNFHSSSPVPPPFVADVSRSSFRGSPTPNNKRPPAPPPPRRSENTHLSCTTLMS